jgi:hypothetical protein
MHRAFGEKELSWHDSGVEDEHMKRDIPFAVCLCK